MKVTELVGADSLRYKIFVDFSSVSDWAKPYVKDVIAAKVFNGTSMTTISPKSTFTHAEALAAIRNLLVEANLINR